MVINLKSSIYILLFFSFFVLGYSGYLNVPDFEVRLKESFDKSYTPDYTNATGEEISFVYIGASGCASANQEGFPTTIRKLKRRVRKYAESSGRSFSAVGVATDWKPEDGIKHLRKFGTFDEVMAGRNWMNIGALKYMWEDIPGKPATPQIVIVKRENHVDRGIRYEIKEEELLTRKVGQKEIRRWIDRGIPLPSLDGSTTAKQSS